MRVWQSGFTYLLALFALAAASVVSLRAIPVVETWEQREKEAELLFVGRQFRDAIESYYLNSPGAIKRYPQSLEDLLLDLRFAGIKRHLRKVYVDPFTRKTEWGLIRDGDGGIRGVHSLHDGRPAKQGGHEPTEIRFTGGDSYTKWRFEFHLN